VEGLGGTYGVRPNYVENKGSVFWFEIPYVPDITNTQGASTALNTSISKKSYQHHNSNSHRINVFNDVKTSSYNSLTQSMRAITTDEYKEVNHLSPTDRQSNGGTMKNFDNFDLSVYVIDDAPSIRKLSHRALNKLGISKVETFVNGVEGLEAMMKHEVDIVFTDFQMPLMTGPEVRILNAVC
jgi:CheY-like chemotaxis protein